MIATRWHLVASALLALPAFTSAQVYLNDQNISVALGASMDPEPFANHTTAEGLMRLIDAPAADAPEDHTQSTHVWVSGGHLELDFDLAVEYDLQSLHIWNYFGEGFDVDNIDFLFYDAKGAPVGSLLGVEPALGGAGGNPIFAENIPLSFPSQVRFVNAVLSGSNGQVDFNNLGFTGAQSCPPASSSNYGTGLAGTVGVPSLTAASPPAFGATVSLDLGNSSGAVGDWAIIGVGYQQASVPLFGGTLWIAPVATEAALTTASGISVLLPIPNTQALCGYELFAQGLQFDAGAVQGFALSPGLRLQVGN